QQEQQERDQQEKERQDRQKQQEEQQGAEGASREVEGQMSREEAEILLINQAEEESRMRAEQKKVRKARRPPVLKNW
ncbi:MAG: hypothetical protein U9R44_05490, partial [Candidatus Omnitrophota bacterium]|nr:hypothetical protein [Candidatus Omnitrophota bacterium]